MAPLSQNQFDIQPIQGMLDLQFNQAVLSAVVDSTQATALVPGQAVKLVNGNGPYGLPSVVACSAASDDVFGFVNYDIKSSDFPANSRVELSAMRNNVMFMTADAAIAAYAKVMIVVADKEVATATGGNTIVGRALDQASDAGDLIRVEIDLPGTTA